LILNFSVLVLGYSSLQGNPPKNPIIKKFSDSLTEVNGAYTLTDAGKAMLVSSINGQCCSTTKAIMVWSENLPDGSPP
jgi:hypothetical protein